MNYNKAITFSAPDAPHLHWLPILAFHGIAVWHGRRFDEPLTYLSNQMRLKKGWSVVKWIKG